MDGRRPKLVIFFLNHVFKTFQQMLSGKIVLKRNSIYSKAPRPSGGMYAFRLHHAERFCPCCGTRCDRAYSLRRHLKEQHEAHNLEVNQESSTRRAAR